MSGLQSTTALGPLNTTYFDYYSWSLEWEEAMALWDKLYGGRHHEPRPLLELCHLTSIFVLCAIGLLSIPILMTVILTKSYRKHSYTLYLTIMSIYDLLLVLEIMVIYGMQLFAPDHTDAAFFVASKSYLLLLFCSYCNFVAGLSSIWLNVALAADRFIVIVFPFQKDRLCTRKSSWVVCGVLLLATHSLGIFILLEPFYARDRFRYFAILLYFMEIIEKFFGLIVSGFLIFILSTASTIKIYQLSQKRKKMTSTSSGKKERVPRAAVSLVTIGISTWVSQTPQALMSLTIIFLMRMDEDVFERLFDETGVKIINVVVHIMSTVVYIQNFFILLAFNAPFREDVKKLFGCHVNANAQQQSTKPHRTKFPNGQKSQI